MVKKKILSLVLLLILSISFASALTIEEINSSTEKTPLVFFYRPSCGHCQATINWLDGIKNNYENIEVIYINIDEENELFWEVINTYGINETSFPLPLLFIGENHFIGPDEVNQKLESKLGTINEKELLGNFEIEPLQEDGINILVFLGLAITDMINPCELAVLIILMTAILTRYPKQKNKALKAGLLFSLAIFIMYFIFGLILREVFTIVSGTFGQVFFLGLGVLAIIMGLMNIKDAIWYGGGGFIMEVPQKWRPKMKAIINGTISPKGAFVVGLIVAFFLTPCTAGPYIAFSGLLSKLSIVSALPYLFAYMCIFILPMVVITVITYFGFAKVEDMGGWRERNLKKLHWIAGLLMLGIGIWMILTSFGIL